VPKLNSRGQAISGTGGMPGSLDKVLYPFVTDGSGAWFDNDTIVVQLHPQSLLATWKPFEPNAKPRIIEPQRGANSVAANAGRYIALIAGDSPILYGNTIEDLKGSGFGDIASDGTIAFKTAYFADWGITIITPNETEITLPSASPVGLQALPGGKAIWHGGAFGREPVKPALSNALGVLLCTVDNEDWLFYWSEGIGFVAQLDGASDGYILESHPTAFGYDVRNVNNQIMVAWSTTLGEGPNDLVKIILDRTKPRVKLVLVTPVPNPNPAPSPTPTPIPIPSPTPTPIPNPQVPLFKPIREANFVNPETVSLVCFDHYARVLNGKVVFDQTTESAETDWEITKPDDRFAISPLSDKTKYLGMDSTTYGNDICKQFYLTDARGNYESFFIGVRPSGLIEAVIEYINQGVNNTVPFASAVITIKKK